MKLVWACTVHKVQGLSLKSGIISFDLERQKSFNKGQVYVALSRITNFESMYLIGTYQRSAIRLNLSAKSEYVRLREESKMTPLPKLVLTNVLLTLTLLHARSLKKHVIDILEDTGLLQNYVLALIEI